VGANQIEVDDLARRLIEQIASFRSILSDYERIATERHCASAGADTDSFHRFLDELEMADEALRELADKFGASDPS
jgi:hypothetical protein